jgi:ubiquinone/menaquinone biosynthesis C-methylase UbiE
LRKKIHNFLGDVKNKKILFVGCGDGLECVSAVKKGAKVKGIDISEKAVELARKNCPNAEFNVIDFERTPFKDNSFNIIISILSIMYKKNLTSCLKELKRILKKEGYIILVVPHPIRKMVKYNDMNYFVKGKKYENWRGVKRFNYYRLFEDYFNSFFDSKFKVKKLIEPKPPKETKKTPDSEVNHPHFLIFKLVND